MYHILVIRQDAGALEPAAAGVGPTGLRASVRATGFIIGVGGGGRGARRGAGFSIDLPAYENDVLNALALTGGFPGTDAVNEVIIERGAFGDGRERDGLVQAMQGCGPLAARGGRRIRIPLRARPGEPLDIRPEDVTLQTGDIVYIEAREADVFYTGGLLPAGEYTLPRDTDLDVVEAILRIGGAVNSGGLNTINITGSLIQPGFGFPSPSLVSVIRRTPGGGQVAIRVDINKALRDPHERILIQPRDIVMLQERPEEAIARYLSGIFRFDIAYTFVNSSRATGTVQGVTLAQPTP
jgi:hypothetical protein